MAKVFELRDVESGKVLAALHTVDDVTPGDLYLLLRAGDFHVEPAREGLEGFPPNFTPKGYQRSKARGSR
jgi:hypothetical protein